ncbi:MAG: ferroxidase [Acidimicrobiaceae bacterium]|nr:MAG: ferroxidase [Acidimicrobiaceae bacterium]
MLMMSGGALLLVACGDGTSAAPPASIGGVAVGPLDPAVARREELRRRPGAATVKATVEAAPTTVSIGGREVSTWAFGDRPGDGGIRAKVGDVLEATFVNRLAASNTLHWHGIALRNDMDGVHDLTQHAVGEGDRFTYRFTLPDAGTYWFHPHMGLELDRGLYAPLIVEDPNDPVEFDIDVVLMLDDWLDGYGRTQEEVLAELQQGGGHSSMEHMGGMGDMGSMMGGLNGDVVYPLHVINGRGPLERETVTAKPGQRVRLRLINAGSDTPYRVAVGGHRLTVTHADGFPVEPVEVDNVLLGMGERYDVIVTVQSGSFPIVAVPEGKDDPAAEAVLSTGGSASPPAAGSRPAELAGRTLAYDDLVATDEVRLASRQPDRSETIALTADGARYIHGINGVSFPDSAPIAVREGERLRLRVVNETMMFHPIHLHGHTFQMVGKGSARKGTARKDTVNVLPMSSVEIDVEADNPGQWMLHCHNTYHLETGMATVLSYRA